MPNQMAALYKGVIGTFQRAQFSEFYVAEGDTERARKIERGEGELENLEGIESASSFFLSLYFSFQDWEYKLGEGKGFVICSKRLGWKIVRGKVGDLE